MSEILKPYWQRRRDAKLANTLKKEIVSGAHKKQLDRFYALKATLAPKKCENCGESLASTISFHPRAHICHIVDKSPVNGCVSVAVHPSNCWYGCLDCHTFYDSQPAERVREMAVIPVLRKRLKGFINEIAEDEKRRVPEYLKETKK